MQFISNIPNAVLFNIGFMAILYLAYETIKYFTKITANQLFILAVGIEFFGLVQFVVGFFTPNRILIYSIPNSIVNTTSSFIQWYYQQENLVYLGIAYFIFLLIFILSGIIQLNKLSSIRQSANYSSSNYWNQQVQASFQTRMYIKIGLSNSVDTPITFGWLDPIILLPISLCNQLSIDEIKIILLHEIAHIIRKDYFVHVVVSLFHTILYFNPISYLLMKEINIQREMACDSWVVAHSNNPIQYSKILFEIANQNVQVLHNNFILNFLAKQNELLIRIKHINRISTKNSKSFLKLFFLVILSCFTVLFSINQSASKIFIKTSINSFQKASNTQIQKQKFLKEKKVSYPIAVEKVKNYKNTRFTVLRRPMVIKINSESNVNMTKEVETSSTAYTKIVDYTLQWIKQHENINQLASYDLKKDSLAYDFAEKLILKSILKSYQFKKDILKAKMTEASNQKEAYDFIMNSKEWDEIQRYELWTKEFLLKHPGTFNQVDSSQLY